MAEYIDIEATASSSSADNANNIPSLNEQLHHKYSDNIENEPMVNYQHEEYERNSFLVDDDDPEPIAKRRRCSTPVDNIPSTQAIADELNRSNNAVPEDNVNHLEEVNNEEERIERSSEVTIATYLSFCRKIFYGPSTISPKKTKTMHNIVIVAYIDVERGNRTANMTYKNIANMAKYTGKWTYKYIRIENYGSRDKPDFPDVPFFNFAIMMVGQPYNTKSPYPTEWDVVPNINKFWIDKSTADYLMSVSYHDMYENVKLIDDIRFPTALDIKTYGMPDEQMIADFAICNNIKDKDELKYIYELIATVQQSPENNMAAIKQLVETTSDKEIQNHMLNAYKAMKRPRVMQIFTAVMDSVYSTPKAYNSRVSASVYFLTLVHQYMDRLVTMEVKKALLSKEELNKYIEYREQYPDVTPDQIAHIEQLMKTLIRKYTNSRAVMLYVLRQRIPLLRIVQRICHPQQRSFATFLYGPISTGKSYFTETIRELFDGATINMNNISDNQKFEIGHITATKRLAVIQDITAEGVYGLSQNMSMLDGIPICVNRKYAVHMSYERFPPILITANDQKTRLRVKKP